MPQITQSDARLTGAQFAQPIYFNASEVGDPRWYVLCADRNLLLYDSTGKLTDALATGFPAGLTAMDVSDENGDGNVWAIAGSTLYSLVENAGALEVGAQEDILTAGATWVLAATAYDSTTLLRARENGDILQSLNGPTYPLRGEIVVSGSFVIHPYGRGGVQLRSAGDPSVVLDQSDGVIAGAVVAAAYSPYDSRVYLFNDHGEIAVLALDATNPAAPTLTRTALVDLPVLSSGKFHGRVVMSPDGSGQPRLTVVAVEYRRAYIFDITTDPDAPRLIAQREFAAPSSPVAVLGTIGAATILSWADPSLARVRLPVVNGTIYGPTTARGRLLVHDGAVSKVSVP